MLFFSGFALGLGLGVSCTFAFVQWKALADKKNWTRLEDLLNKDEDNF